MIRSSLKCYIGLRLKKGQNEATLTLEECNARLHLKWTDLVLCTGKGRKRLDAQPMRHKMTIKCYFTKIKQENTSSLVLSNKSLDFL